jgi:hypothetical protein
MDEAFNVRLILRNLCAIVLLAPGACGTTRPIRFDPATASLLLAFLIVTSLAMPALAARRKPGMNEPCAVRQTGPS